MNQVIAIFGPTGAGKTDVAVNVAARLSTEVVNCDPAQCYKGLPTLANKPTAEHDAIAKHRMIGVWDLDFESSIAIFAKQCHDEIDDVISKFGRVVLCGGSGLYLQAALTDLVDQPDSATKEYDRSLRDELELAYDLNGGEVLLQELRELDPVVGNKLHVNDKNRIVRALAVARLGGSISPNGGSHWDASPRIPYSLFGLNVDRDVMRERIKVRTKKMFDAGMVEEVAGVVGANAELAGSTFSETAIKLHGVSECIDVLNKTWSKEDALESMTTRTQKYVKRQDTWARRWPNLQKIEATNADISYITDEIMKCL